MTPLTPEQLADRALLRAALAVAIDHDTRYLRLEAEHLPPAAQANVKARIAAWRRLRARADLTLPPATDTTGDLA